MIYKDAFCQTSPFSFPTSYHCILISLPSLLLILLHTFLGLQESAVSGVLGYFRFNHLLPLSCPFQQFFCSQYTSLHTRCSQLQIESTWTIKLPISTGCLCSLGPKTISSGPRDLPAFYACEVFGDMCLVNRTHLSHRKSRLGTSLGLRFPCRKSPKSA